MLKAKPDVQWPTCKSPFRDFLFVYSTPEHMELRGLKEPCYQIPCHPAQIKLQQKVTVQINFDEFRSILRKIGQKMTDY